MVSNKKVVALCRSYVFCDSTVQNFVELSGCYASRSEKFHWPFRLQ